MSVPAAGSAIVRRLSRRKQVDRSNSKLRKTNDHPFRNGSMSGRQTEDPIFFPVAFARGHIFQRANMRGSYMGGSKRPGWMTRRTACIRCEGTKPTQIYKKTGNLRAIQLLLGYTKLESAVRYLGIEVDDALSISEQVEL